MHTDLSSAFGVGGVLCAVFMIIVASIALYTRGPATIFLRLGITELKRVVPPTNEPLHR